MLHEVAAFLKRHEDNLRSEIAKLETKLSQGATTTPADLQGLKAAADEAAAAHASVAEAAGPAPVVEEATADAPAPDTADETATDSEPAADAASSDTSAAAEETATA